MRYWLLVCSLFWALGLTPIKGADRLVPEENFGAFFTVVGDANSIALDDDIGSTTPLEFLRTLKAHPGAKLLYLNSDGGLIDSALIIAHEVRERNIATFIPTGSRCYSVCALIYLAGQPRAVGGELGVHQVWNEKNDLAAGQAILSNVLEALSEFGTDPVVLATMLRTPLDQMHVFTREELIQLHLESGDPLSMRAPNPLFEQQAAVVLDVAPIPHDRPASLRDLGTENVTVVPMTTSPGSKEALTERLVAVDDPAPLADVLLDNGFTQREVGLVLMTMYNVRPSRDVEAGTRLRILFGPAHDADILMPYRLSIYDADPATGELKHSVTVALTDRSDYVLAMEPPPLPGEAASPVKEASAEHSSTGKNDRAPARTTDDPPAKPIVRSDSDALLLEASESGTTGAVPFSGTVEWSKGQDEIGQPTLAGKANIPGRNLRVDLLIRKNSDPHLPASHLLEINFRVSDSFVGGSIAGVPGVLLKNEELVQGSPLIGASARVVGNSFLFALSASPGDVTSNVALLTQRKWIDLAVIYASGKRAIVTLEKSPAAQKLFVETFAAWSVNKSTTSTGGGAVVLQPGFSPN